MIRTYSLVVIIVIFCGSLLVSCNQSAHADAGKLSQGVQERSTLLALDFSSELSGLSCTTFEDFDNNPPDPDAPFSSWLKVMHDQVGKQIPDRQLSAMEYKRLGVWKLNDSEYYNLHMMLSPLGRYHSQNGCLPTSGADVYEDLLESQNLTSFLELTKAEQLAHCFPMINVFTGKLYETFAADEWAPGAINIEVVDDPEIIESDYSKYMVPTDPLNVQGDYKPAGCVWIITMYGEAQDSILWEFEWIQ